MGEFEMELRELSRLFGDRPSAWNADVLDEFDASEVEWYRTLPGDLRTVAEFFGYEEMLPHDEVRMLFGPVELIEWNGDDGTFGQLRSVVDNYAFDRVVMIGEDTYLDLAGQLGAPGAVLTAIGHELEGARTVAGSLLELLQQAGAPLPEDPPPGETTTSVLSDAPAWTPTRVYEGTSLGVSYAVAVPVSFTIEEWADGTGFRAFTSDQACSIGVTILPDLADPREEFVMAMGEVETDDMGGIVTTTRLLRAGAGFIRCYVKGGTPEDRRVVCDSLTYR